MLREDFARILPFDSAAARAYAAIAATRRAAARPIAQPMARSPARSRGMSVATRNIRGIGVDLIDPWDAGDE